VSICEWPGEKDDNWITKSYVGLLVERICVCVDTDLSVNMLRIIRAECDRLLDVGLGV
jgi:hypothetical protein